MIIRIIFWVIIWFISWIIIYILGKKNSAFLTGWKTITFLYLLAALSVLLIFQSALFRLYVNPKSILFVFPVFLSFLIYNFSRNNLRANHKKIFATEPVFSFDYRYLLIKIWDIFYQQLLISSLLVTLSTLSASRIIISFSLLFAFVHIPILFYKQLPFSLIFLFSALFGGIIFSFTWILFPAWAVIINYSIHLLFYILLGIFGKFIKSKKS